MIISKPIQNVSGYVEYRYDYKQSLLTENPTDEDKETMFTGKGFNSLEELLNLIKQKELDKVKEEYEADIVLISSITFDGKSEDSKTTSQLHLCEDGNGGHVATKIENQDITDRAMLNMEVIKKIADNTLEHFPVKY